MTSLLRSFVNINSRISRLIDKALLPTFFIKDGNRFFYESFITEYMVKNITVYDIGGGKRPFLSRSEKEDKNIKLIGFDIDQEELSKAPEGIYDKTICADICNYKGEGDADLVVCQALLEHVKSLEFALSGIKSILKPGGRAVIFVPSRNAVFARLNLLLPESFKKKILVSIYPQAKDIQGFPAYYDHCTPNGFQKIAIEKLGFEIEKASYHYMSAYFTFFFPLHLLWRVWILLFYMIAKEEAAETFSLTLRKV
ncbi:MAG TPA: methyltransferase domain-containing protein [Oligoflexia bacterium]|nr:methyltransferase domain-containing protein [Oligoflexia bacterium]HMP48573.1 methyltransferase domain-containing protein [Oligoflexia bacterium]